MLVLPAGILINLQNGCLMFYLIVLVNAMTIVKFIRLESMEGTLSIRPFLADMVVLTYLFTAERGEMYEI